MRRVVVRYAVKPERLAEHEALIQGVFADLAVASPPGLGYEVVKLADGVSFVHTASVAGAENPLTRLDAFKRFTADIGSRVEAPPVSSEATLVGAYGVQRAADDAR